MVLVTKPMNTFPELPPGHVLMVLLCLGKFSIVLWSLPGTGLFIIESTWHHLHTPTNYVTSDVSAVFILMGVNTCANHNFYYFDL